MSERWFPNPYPDYSGETVLTEGGQLPKSYQEQLDDKIQEWLRHLDSASVEKDDSVYTGSSGIAVLYLHLHERTGASSGDAYLQKALQHVKGPLASLRGRRLSFMCGDAGPLALGAIIYHKLGRTKESRECIDRLESLHKQVLEDSSLPDELLYGRAGYLYALLLLQRKLGFDHVNLEIITKVVEAIVSSGQAMSADQDWSHPLMYAWHDKHYLGAAHGLAGIFYTLMQVKGPKIDKILKTKVKPSIDYMLSLQFPSGNCPSSIGSSSGDKLVHFCHGAPGWIHMFVLAYKTFNEDRYLEAAKGCADVIWERGLLKKGYGLCHGTAGNGYAFITMYKLTRDKKYLYRACKFADWCCEYGKHSCGTPDRPYSLFEGLAGTIHFVSDLRDPENAKFPAFEL